MQGQDGGISVWETAEELATAFTNMNEWLTKHNPLNDGQMQDLYLNTLIYPFR